MRRTKKMSRWTAMMLAFILAFMSVPMSVVAEETDENELDYVGTYDEVLNYATGANNNYEGRYFDIDPLFNVPYVSTYYFNPKPSCYEDIIIPIYITDSIQSEYMKNDNTVTLDIIYEVDGVSTTVENVPLGDYNLNIGRLSKGTHIVAIQTFDKRSGMKSHKLYNDLWVIDPVEYEITEAQTYIMKEEDLEKYKINMYGSTNPDDLNNTRDGLTQFFIDVRDQGYRKVVLIEGIYRINGVVDRTKCISIPSYLTVDMNKSTFKLDTVLTELNDPDPEMPAASNKGVACIVVMNDVIDAHLINGTIEGDRFERQEHNLETEKANRNAVGEQIMSISIIGGKYCSISDLTVKNTTGYTIGCGAHWGKYQGLYSFTRTAIIDGKEVVKENCSTSDMLDLQFCIDWNKEEDYMYVGHFLGNRGILGESEIVYVSFYDKDRNFMKTVTGYQYRKVLIPAGAQYARVTVLGTEFPAAGNAGDLFIYAENLAEYHEISNISFVDTRTCALVPTSCNNLLIENNTYTRCGNSVTSIAVDMEDGWEECQDIYYRNNVVLVSAGTGTVVDCAGMNHVYENNIGHSIEIRHRLSGGVIRNTNDVTSSVNWNIGNWKCGFFGRIYNNNIGNIVFAADRINENKKAVERVCVNFKVKNCTIHNDANTITWLKGVPDKVVFENCIFPKFAGSNAVFKNCIIQPGNKMNNNTYFYDCTFKVIEGDADSISLNLSTPFDADRLFKNCKFEGKTSLGGLFHSGVFRDCEFDDLTIFTYVNSAEAEVLFENCKINSTSTAFITNGPYAKMYDYVKFKFKNCEITHTGSDLIYFSAEPTKNSKFIFEDCTIKKTTGYLTKWEGGYWAELYRGEVSVDVIFKNTDVDRSLSIDKAVDANQARVSFENGLESKLMGYTIGLTGQIAINFYIQLPDTVRNNSSAYVHFDLPGGGSQDVKVSEGVAATNYSKTYIYTCEVPATQMTSSVAVQVQIPSTGKYGVKYRYSVKDYADYILSHTGEFKAEEVELVKAMLNYGGYAQQYFGVHTNMPANEGLYTDSTDPVLKATGSITASAVTGTMSDKNISYVGASLVCDGETSLKFYYKINSGVDASKLASRYTLKATLNSKDRKCDATVSDGFYIVTLHDINASELDLYFAFTFTDNNTKSATINFKYSPVNYMDQAQKSSNTDLVELTKAMYLYNQAAKKVK